MILTLILILGLVLSLIKPSIFKKVFKEKANRTHLSLYFILAIIGSFIWFWLTTPTEDESGTIVWESEPIKEIVKPTIEQIERIQPDVEAVPVVEEIEVVEVETELTIEEIEVEVEEAEIDPVEVEPVIEEIKPPEKNLEPSIIGYEILREWNPDSDGQGLGLEILISKDDVTKANIIALVESLSKPDIKIAVVKIYQSREARNQEQIGSFRFTDEYRNDYLAYFTKDFTYKITFESINEIRWKQKEWKLQDLYWTRTEIR